MKQRINRVGEQMKQELSDIIARRLKDPRIGFITITGVEVTGDLQQAKVYITSLGDEKAQSETLEGLKKATGFIRSEIGKRMQLRVIPELIFLFDESVAYGNHIENLLAEIQKDDQ